MMTIHKKWQYALLAMLLALVPGLVAAQSGNQPIAKADYDVKNLQFPALNDIQIPEPRVVTLDNGMKIFLLEDHELPEIGMFARVGTGSLWEPADKIGLAGLTGTVMRTGGTTSMQPDQLDTALANIGATVETGIGENSGFAFMNTLSDNIGTVLPIFADVLMNPAFAEDKITLAKTRITSGISRRNDDPTAVARREFSQLLYGADSPYARVPEYYTIKRIQRDDLVAFHDKYFVPNNVLLAVWGDFDTDQMLDRLRKAFGSWQKVADFQRPAPPSVTGGKAPGVYYVPDSDVTQSMVLMGHMGEITRDNPDYFPVTVMNQVLSGGFAGRLMRNVRADQGLAYSVYGSYSTGYDHVGSFRAGVGTKTATTVQAARSVEEQIRSMQTKAPTAEELATAKQSFLNSFVFNFDTRREILGRLMTYEYYGYPHDFLDQIKRGIEAVTAEDVLRVAKKYLHPDQLVILVEGDIAELDPPLSTLAADGKTHEIDITIPTTAPDNQAAPASQADQAAGTQLLDKVRGALGGKAFATVKTLSAASTSTLQSPAGEQTTKSAIKVSFPDQFRADATLPNGMNVSIIADGDNMVMKLGQRSMPAPAQLARQTRSQLWHSLAYLMVRADDVSVAAGDDVTVDGKTLKRLDITPPGDASAFTMLIDPATHLPARLRFQSVTPAGPVDVEQVLSDWRDIDGIKVPFKLETFHGGEPKASGVATSFEVNPKLDPTLFTTE